MIQNLLSLTGAILRMARLTSGGKRAGVGAVMRERASGTVFATPGMCFVVKHEEPALASMRAISRMIALRGLDLLVPFSMALRAARLSDLISNRVQAGA